MKSLMYSLSCFSIKEADQIKCKILIQRTKAFKKAGEEATRSKNPVLPSEENAHIEVDLWAAVAVAPAVPVLAQLKQWLMPPAALATVVALAAALISFGDPPPNPPGPFMALAPVLPYPTPVAPPGIYPSLPSFSESSHGKHGDMVSPSHTWQGTQFGWDPSSFPAGQFLLRQVPIERVNENGQPAGLMLVYNPFTTSDLYNWKENNPAYRDAPKPITDLFESIFTMHHPIWAAV